ncbi:hypothetical protein [Sulfitobacter sp. PS-8MA]|uniref:hypothetical protein n=1 Tax=Sulfitobacter sp. PS-8MA TaxID=3237707 RepID=UPI0034C63635
MQDQTVIAGDVLARAKPSTGRRVVALISLVGLGAVLLHAALTQPVDAGWRVALILLGLAFIALAELMRRSTGSSIELTPELLRDADGTVILRLEEIERIEMGYFAMKPSNGFLLKSRVRQPRGWRLGLWWRLGRRVGVGGMTPGRETKYIAEMISARLAERQAR